MWHKEKRYCNIYQVVPGITPYVHDDEKLRGRSSTATAAVEAKSYYVSEVDIAFRMQRYSGGCGVWAVSLFHLKQVNHPGLTRDNPSSFVCVLVVLWANFLEQGPRSFLSV